MVNELKPKRVLCIGDIHGNFKALEQVLTKSKYDYSKDKLIFLGDYVDGLPDSYKVVNKLLEIEKNSVFKPIFIKGNHDIWFRDYLNMGKKEDIWLLQGGKETLESYEQAGLYRYSLEMDIHRNFFNKLQDFYIDSSNRAFVHGGFEDIRGLGYEDENTYSWDRNLFKQSLFNDKENEELLSNYKQIFIGHTDVTITNKIYFEWLELGLREKISYAPFKTKNIVNLDTGAGFIGVLTIMDIDTGKYWSSDPVKELYPDYKFVK